MLLMTSQILKFADSWRTQKFKYLENKTHFFISEKTSLIAPKGYIIAKEILLANITFNSRLQYFF